MSSLFTLILAFSILVQNALAAAYNYDSARLAQSIPDNGCSTSNYRNVTFNITDNFTVTDLNVGVDLAHTSRGQVRVRVQGPGDASATTIKATATDGDDNLDILIDDASSNAIDDNTADSIDDSGYERTVGPSTNGALDGFNNRNSVGTWTVSFCDNASSTTGTVYYVSLYFTGTAVGNTAPTVNAGSDQTISFGQTANLDGTVTDDGYSGRPLTTTWSKQSGPGTVTFGNANLVDTTATFSVAGVYVLRLTATDTEFTVYDEVTINVLSSFENTTTGNIYGTSGCTLWPASRYFLITEHFTVTDLNVGFNVSHTDREKIRMFLTSPSGTTRELVTTYDATTYANYDILLDGDTGGALNDGSNDTVASPYYDRTVQQTLLNNFDGEDAFGGWKMSVCVNSGTTDGDFNRATLYFNGTPIDVIPPLHKAGPPVVETYFIPFPEDQMWTAMNSIFSPGRTITSDDTCTDFATYDGNPRQPFINYIGLTIVDADTVITYDQWEDGYEAAISYPSQNTTEVWGDGDLKNGVAPGDADDILQVGQILVLDSVMNTTTLQSVIDYDARDKIAASKPIAVTRTGWSDGSQTLFTSADEVYPTDRWGTEYRLPVGENADLNEMFQYTGVSVMAAVDGTVVSIDKTADGTAEMTCNLNQGQSCQWNDPSADELGGSGIGSNGLNRGSKITSNNGHPIQVSLLTGDYCAGFETRSYTLSPVEQWDSSYYSPVGTQTSNPGAPSNDDAPTTVHLYNAGTSSITVTYAFQSGTTSSVTVGANSGANVTMTDLNGAHFYTTSGAKFFAVGSVDSDFAPDHTSNDRNDTYDWGFTLVPERLLSQFMIVGWAPGDDPTYIGSAPENTAPIWLTGGHPAAQPLSPQPLGPQPLGPQDAFDICIDDGGNGGSLTDPITGRAYDRKITGVAVRSQRKIYNGGSAVDGEDQTGMQIWVCGPVVSGVNSDAALTAAWGEDPLTAERGKPAMDEGFTIRNNPAWRATKNASLAWDKNGNGLYDEGDTIGYNLVVVNSGVNPIPANTLNVLDTLPSNVTYVASSTYLIDHNNIKTQILDNGSGTIFPLDGTGYTYSQILPVNKYFTVQFEATINSGACDPPGTVTNVLTLTDSKLTSNPLVTIPVAACGKGAIGDRVWLDEDGDGDQDAGEAGLANVKVELYQGATLVATTYTDSNGLYLFSNLDKGSYTVKVVTSSLPSGLAANQTYDEDGLGTANQATVNLSPGEEHLTTDFGYNWSSTTETNNPTSSSTGAIGDRVWIDTDGDNIQDADEVGLSGVTVQLYYDANGDGLYNELYTVGSYNPTTTTNANGNYIFDNLPSGSYVVKVTPPGGGYSQTGDPDYPGVACSGGQCDNQTTAPVILGPGDVFVNADFGYQPPENTNGDVGDFVWLDADRDGVQDIGEPGIPGVTVALIKDTNADGSWDIDGIDNILGNGDDEPVIATQITDASGLYLFGGLPVTNGTGTDDYLVWANDTQNVLFGLSQSFDSFGGLDNLGRVSDLDVTGNLNQDFGYGAPRPVPANTGVIGDTVFIDYNTNGLPDAGEGIEGVTVKLYESDGVTLIKSVVTDENGRYFFGNIDPNATYKVQVAVSTLPAGLTNTADPDDDGIDNNGDEDSSSTVTLTSASPVNLLQDFGYRDLSNPNTISGTLWNDLDSDGFLDGTEGVRFENVTVVLRSSSGNVIASTTTDANGDYSFTNLPDGTYQVDVTDENKVLNGYWKSNCPSGNCGQDNYSQSDPYTVTVSGGQTNTTGDFGYYLKPAALGNYVWEDLDQDGIQDGGELPIPNAKVTLTITYPSGAVATLVAYTSASGYYGFDNLFLDEDLDGVGTAGIGGTEPLLSISVQTPAGYSPTLPNQGADDTIDSDYSSGQIANLVKGGVDISYDFGYFPNPGVIGDRVWLDENGDGIQDAGEAGIPNVKVTLTGTDQYGNVINRTTYTDTNGEYIFSGLWPANYTVTVDTSTLPVGLTNQTYDENGTGTPNTTTVALALREEHLTADFGYNWAPTTDVQGNTGNGTIGDRVWLDANGDGVQDSEEPGISGVTVQLWYDSNTDGIIDAQYGASKTTNATGNYIFDGLPAGLYEVRVTPPTYFQQTGDPDQPDQTCTICDSKTTAPIVLSAGDVYVNADFGYQPDALNNTIGDTIWLDADRDTTQDAWEPGIPGVEVQLTWAGTDGNFGTPDDVVYTTTTGENGNYLFTDLPDGNFRVEVPAVNFAVGGALNDAQNPTYDADGTGTPNQSTITGLGVGNNNPASNLNQDFGYSPSNGTPPDGVIGDTVFYDANNNGIFNVGDSGLPGVKVDLYTDPDGNPATLDGALVATTYTNSGGLYAFGDLDPTLKYLVVVTPPAGLTNTVDPDGASPTDRSLVNLGALNSDGVNDPDGVDNGINLGQDFGYIGDAPLLNTIGDTIWLDADRDATKDAWEPGIPGVEVKLTWAGTDGVFGTPDDVVYTTPTDENGNYLFTDLPDGNFRVEVPAVNFGVGGALNDAQNPTYDADGTGTANQSTITNLGVGNPNPAVDLNQDFGYSPSNGTPPDGIIGDTVFFDANGNGILDAGDSGLPGVKVELYIDPDGNPATIDGALVGTTYTNSGGLYAFGDLNPTGQFLVVVTPPAGLTNTVDPDSATPTDRSLVNLGASGSDGVNDPDGLDNGINLGQDFGYQLSNNLVGKVGDRVWFDADGDATQDAGEPGIPGVTVALIKDDGDGVYEPGIDPIIATDTTDANGNYLFAGLPTTDGVGTDDYLVWVNDTDSVLFGLAQTYDSFGALDNIGRASDLSPAGDLGQDFGYKAPNQTATKGLIGDTIFIDYNTNGLPDAGEGREGVTVRLYAADGTSLIAETITDENGHYYFGGLTVTASTNFVVKVDTTTLPAGVTNTVDPDGGNNSQSTVTLSPGSLVNLLQDFGYRDTSNPNTISGTLWNDLDAGGTLDSDEPGRFAGVTVVLYDNNGNVVSTTTTDANGNYSFTNLPDGTYKVDVKENTGGLPGYWHSIGGAPGNDNNSQADPYTVTVSGGANNTTGDFGYYIKPAELGNFVWFDTDYDGIQDGNELGIANVKVTLEITYPNGTLATLVTNTDAHGYYSFKNLLIDENFDGVGTFAVPGVGGGNEPAFVVKVVVPSGMSPSPANAGSDDGRDSDYNATGYQVYPLQGSADLSIDFGFNPGPTAVTMAGFYAVFVDDVTVLIHWESIFETNIAGYNIYRSTTWDGPRMLVNAGLIPAQGSDSGSVYEYPDPGVQAGTTYYYWLYLVVAPDNSEVQSDLPPAIATKSNPVYLPFIIR